MITKTRAVFEALRGNGFPLSIHKIESGEYYAYVGDTKSFVSGIGWGKTRHDAIRNAINDYYMTEGDFLVKPRELIKW